MKQTFFTLILFLFISVFELFGTQDLNNDSSQFTLFTQKHLDYFSQKKSLKMCVDPKWLPFETIDNGEYKGIVADIFSSLQVKLPIPIELIQTQTWSESLESVKKRRCDFLAAAAKTKEREQYLNFTNSYLNFPQVIVTKVHTPFIEDFETILEEKIGVVKNSAIAELIKQKYPSINLVNVDSVLDGLEKVNDGHLFGFVNTSAAVSYYMAKKGFLNLKISSKVGIDYFLRTGVRNDDPILLEVFNILINTLQKQEVNEIKSKWLQVKVEEMVDYSIVYKTIFFFVIIILFILIWNKRLQDEITQRKKLQKELGKLSQIIEQSNVSVILTDTEGVIEYVNNFCAKQAGYTKEELIGQKPSVFKSGYHNQELYDELWSMISEGDTWYGELANKKKTGEIFWESAVIAPIFDKSGNILWYASIKEAINEKILAREELLSAQEEAINANKAKSEFLAKMSHEIRTPMNAVLGMLYLLEKTDIDGVQENYVTKAQHAANSLLALINDILDFSKIEAGKLVMVEEEFEFNEMIMDVMSVMGFKAEEKNIELLANYDLEIPQFIISDKLRINQILTNLISNGIKFTNKGEVIVSTKLIKSTKDSLEIMFCIQDSGIGIPKESLGSLFEEFSQIDNSATRHYEGTGLGLVICKKLVELLGGRIWIEDSQVGVGTTFCFTINVKYSLKEIPKQKSLAELKNLRCLVVDDNENAVLVLCNMLESFGYTVVSCTDGKDAIGYIKKEQFDMVFLDYKMEPLNGIEVFQIVKDDLQKASTKTLLVTAYSKEIIDDKFYELGIDGYLSKPISPSSLYNKIFEIFYLDTPLEKIDKKDHEEIYFQNDRILLVEDNQLNQEFAKHMLESRGLSVDIAIDGIEALSMVKQKQYDLILMDIQMPHMDGLEATKHIRSMDGEYYKLLPIVALSANALSGDREKSLGTGMNEHITKPIDPELLFTTLGKYLDVSDEKVSEIPQEQNNLLEKLDDSIFEIDATLEKLNNSTEVYTKILKNFAISYKDVYSLLEELIAQKEIVKLQDKTHELKGVSGNIGAKYLFQTLVAMDRIVKQEQYPSSQLLKDFKQHFEDVINSIEKVDQKRISSKSFDKELVCDIIDALAYNLDEDISKAQEDLEKLLPYLQEEYLHIANELEADLNNYDVDQAKESLENLKEVIEKNG
jgi:two-component system, sensor histidine kinase and response regulator